MDYNGKYKIFDLAKIRTYPLSKRANKVTLKDLVRPEDIHRLAIELPDKTQGDIESVAHAVVSTRETGAPVVLFTGAHMIKNGLGPLLIDLVSRSAVTLVAGNAATAIHDFELALIGQTSENVPDALGKGQFGMAYEFAYINAAMSLGNEQKLGFGEALGKMICNEHFRRRVLSSLGDANLSVNFLHPEVSVLAACYKNDVPFTVHAGIGTDVTDQHPSFDGQAKGGCSGRDFLIFTNEVTKLTNGGVFLNIGSAVTGPEVFLKAISMAANTGHAPRNIITADFDLRDYRAEQMTDESSQGYYFRDQKSVVTRIPEAFAGNGYYIQGNQKQTFPLLYKMIIDRLSLKDAKR
jgi:hypothetical protein